ncbi:porin family protein [Nordella sp. HKS 07]|uniref:outer membrane protein n=1 Tax=Nordella sp. HKS 07 TaxID=2712222 RepID=UPI0013E155C1|nr:outer membrane protein [Nordella sp. HKS 07]QIG46851.1 porin family protein [Nordella sp. HKS 07]
MRKIFVVTAGLGFVFAGAAHAADPDFASGYDWTGLYLGVHGGYADADWDGTTVYDPGTGPMPELWNDPDQTIGGDGWLGGAQVGFNKQFGNIVVGLEADYSFADVDGEDDFRMIDPAAPNWNVKAKLDELGTVRARVGFALDNVLFYGTGGLAYGKTEADLKVAHPEAPDTLTARGSAEEDHIGWTAGAGVEWGFASNFSLGAEWLYIDLGDADYRLAGTNTVDPGNPIPHTTDSFPADLTMNVFRAKINYRF